MDKDNKHRLDGLGIYFLLLLAVAGGAIVYGMVKVQWIDGDMWRKQSYPREEGLQVQKAHRGNIYSSDGKILATTVPICNLYLDLGHQNQKNKYGNDKLDSLGNPIVTGPIPDSSFHKYLDQVCALLHDAFPQQSAAEFRQRILDGRERKNNRCVLIKRGVPYSTWRQICNLNRHWNHGVVKTVDGKSVIYERRAHTYGNLAENTIGFRNSMESETYTGLEGYYNATLKGSDGRYRVRRLTRGIWLPIESRSDPVNTDGDTLDNMIVRPVVNGKSIVSTIDTRFQDIAESALRDALRKFGGESGCAILMEMSTGYVLACSNLSIDTHAHEYLEMPNRNIAVSDRYEPGSTFKTVVLAAMMNAQALDTSMMLRVGYKNFGGVNGEIKDDHTWQDRDTLSLKQVMEQSSNVGISELGWKLYGNQRDTLKNLVTRIFPYQILNLDLTAGEYKGRVNDLNASRRDFLNFCYGYSTSVSPMQLITFYNGLGAGGRMVKPLFCRAILDGNKEIPVNPVVLNEHICSPHTAAVMKDLLVGVVENGTGNNIKNNTYGIAGKTGTAVHSYKDLRRYNASFVGFFPAEKPKYTCLVVVKDIHAYGRQSAVVFKAIADCVMAIDTTLGNIPIERLTLESQRNGTLRLPYVRRANQQQLMKIYRTLRLNYLGSDSSSHWCAFSPAEDSTATPAHYVGYRPAANVVPDCTGMTARDALLMLRSNGYAVRFSGCGKVISQTPSAGSKAPKGTTTVFLKLGV
ncbi:MAG: penicillin-binding transpeptidase domain-containing protein [Bacteroidales bacterium]|nr:penicillin-binding transpeptidase domain-containing protein [Bacteroidales bacterium]